MARDTFDLRSLPARLVLALVAVVLITLVAVGAPILYLVKTQPGHELLLTEGNIWLILFLAGLAVILLSLVLGYILARRIAAPLEDLVVASESMGRGDLKTPVSSWDSVTEVTALARSLERTRARLRDAYNDLARSKEWSDNLIASLIEGVFTLDADGRISSFSPGAERILGWRATDVVGRAYEAVFRSGAVRDSAPGTVMREAVTTREGRPLVLLITSGAVTRHPEGTSEQAFVFRDVTEEEEALRLREFFLANVSHELKTPLSALRASVELLAGDLHSLTPEEQRELVDSLWLGIIRLEELVDNLLSSASIRSGHFQVNAQPTELEPTLDEIQLTSKPLLALQGQNLVVEIPPSLPLVWADPRRLRQVLVNLISNASKYGPPQSPITIRVQTRGEQVIVNVIDRGEPIVGDDRKGLFQPFTHGDDGASAGVGLGLSIVHTIVERQGGEVGVKRAPEGGNDFWFSLHRVNGAGAKAP